MKKALVVDWLDKYGGAERVISSLQNVFQFQKTYGLTDIMKKDDLEKIFPKDYKIQTTVLRFLGTKFRWLFFTFHYFISKIKIDTDTQLIISSSHAVAKGIKKSNSTQLHISYFQARNFKYIWDEVDLYFGKSKPLFYPLIKLLRKIDVQQAQRPDYIISNSKFVQEWVQKVYHRESVVIYPPVDLSQFNLNVNKEDYFVAVGRIVAYKRFDLIIDAFNILGRKLIVIGNGDQLLKLKKRAKENISFTGYLDSTQVNEIISKAKAFIHIGIEDFGIAPIEAQACGTPVIAYKAGGIVETVLDGKTGILFEKQQVSSLIDAVKKCDSFLFDYEEIRGHAMQFSKENFCKNIREYINERVY